MRMNLIGVVLAFVLVSVPAWAQVPSVSVPTGVDVLVIAAAGDPVTLPALATRSTPIGAALNCNLAATPAPVGTLGNPSTWELEDPFTAGRVCRGPFPTGVPNGVGYRAVAVFTATCDGVPCASPRSLVGVPPFTLAGPQTPPAAPRTLGLRP